MIDPPTLYQQFADYLADSRSFEALHASVIAGVPDGWNATLALSFQLGIMLQRFAPDLARLLQDGAEPEEAICEAIAEMRPAFFAGRVPGCCQVCGCTDEHACEGGCYWRAPDLCSAHGLRAYGGD